jgi:hypothetical protein
VKPTATSHGFREKFVQKFVQSVPQPGAKFVKPQPARCGWFVTLQRLPTSNASCSFYLQKSLTTDGHQRDAGGGRPHRCPSHIQCSRAASRTREPLPCHGSFRQPLTDISARNKGVTRFKFAGNLRKFDHAGEFCGVCAGSKPTGSAALTPFRVHYELEFRPEKVFCSQGSAAFYIVVSSFRSRFA